MKLINFPGLNCYSNGIVSIVHDLGMDFSAAFAGLWSETDFYYQPEREVYLSKRLPDALETLGLKFIMQICDGPQEVEARLAELEEGEPIILGMDAFHVPWSQFYQTFHGPHFFVARYCSEDVLLCYDPTFEQAEVPLSRGAVLAHAYDVSRIVPATKRPPAAHPLADAAEILRVHPQTCQQILQEMEEAAKGDALRAILLGRYMDALQNNRFLYRYYLAQLPPPHQEKQILLGEQVFSTLSALKTGLFKASITQNQGLYQEMQSLFQGLMAEEMDIARKILG